MKVLIVEDECIRSMILKVRFRDVGLNVDKDLYIVRCNEQAISLLQNVVFDVVSLDGFLSYETSEKTVEFLSKHQCNNIKNILIHSLSDKLAEDYMETLGDKYDCLRIPFSEEYIDHISSLIKTAI